MNLNILTSGLITSKFGIRPALMCATRKDLSAHSVVRIVSDNSSGWIGIAYGHLITGAKCQFAEETLNGFEALSHFMKLETGVFDLIQMDNRLLGDELAQSIGISIDELLEQLKNSPNASTIEILRKCRRTDDAITMLMSTEADSRPTASMPQLASAKEAVESSEEDLDWDLGDEGVIESLERQTRVGRRKTTETEMLLFASDAMSTPLPDDTQESLMEDQPLTEAALTAPGSVGGSPAESQDPSPKIQSTGTEPGSTLRPLPIAASDGAPAVLTGVPPASEPGSTGFQPAPADPPKSDSVPMLDSLASDWGTTPPPDPLSSSTVGERIRIPGHTAEFQKLQAAKSFDPDETVTRVSTYYEEKRESEHDSNSESKAVESKQEESKSEERKKSLEDLVFDPEDTIPRAPLAEQKPLDLKSGSAGFQPASDPAVDPLPAPPLPAPPLPAPPPATATSHKLTDGHDIARIREISQNQEVAFEVASIDEVKAAREGGFVIVSAEEQAADKEAALRRQNQVSNDLLGSELRAELQEFVRQKFGVEDSFQKVDIEESKNYQASIVLRDLERSIGKARGEDPGPLLPPRRQTQSVERPAVAEGEARSTLQKLKSQALSQSQSTSAVNPSVERPKANITKAEADRESSRNIFVEQVRKSTEVDAKSFISAQNTDSRLELSILKDKRLRNIIIVGSSIAIVFAGGFFVFFSAERQSSLESASEKLVAQDYKAAKEAYEGILQQNPESWEAHLGHALAVQDDYKQAVVDYKKVLAIRPSEFSAAAGLSKAYFDLKEYAKAADAASLAYKLKPNPSSLKLKANALIKLGRYDDASKVLMEALESNSSNKADLHYMLSGCFKALNNPNGQSACLSKALETDPKNPIYLKEIALLHIARNGDPQKGKEMLEKALKISPGDGELHYNMALLIKDKSPDQAIEELTKAIEHQYDKPEALAERGILYYGKREYGPAKPDLEEALDKKENAKWKRTLDLTDKAINLAKARAGTRTLADSSSESEDLPFKDLTGDYWSKANSAIQSGSNGYAIRLMKAAIRVNPNDSRARRCLATALFNAGEYVGASNQFAYVASQGMSAEEQYMYGKSLSKANRLEPAIGVLKNLVTQQPGYTRARIELIKAYTLAGFNDHAREECQLGMQQSRNSSDYTEFKSLIP